MNAVTLSQSSNESLDYGHPLEFGYFLTPDAGDPLGVLESARIVDTLGYDLVGVQDHPYQSRHLDTSSLLSAILAQTDAVRVFADVANLPLRPPAVLAKAAATLDLLSAGRFELGLGAGGYLDAAHAMGAPARTPAESLAALEEAVAVIRAIGAGSVASVSTDATTSSQAFTRAPPPHTPSRSGSARTCRAHSLSRAGWPTGGSAR